MGSLKRTLLWLLPALAAPPPPALRAAPPGAAQHLADCRFPALRAAQLAGCAEYYAPRPSSSPRGCSSRGAEPRAQGEDVTQSGADRGRLFDLRGGTLALDGLIIVRGHAPDGAVGQG